MMRPLCSRLQFAVLTSTVYFLIALSTARTQVTTVSNGSRNVIFQCVNFGCKTDCLEDLKRSPCDDVVLATEDILSYLLKAEYPPFCIPCDERFTVKHVLLDCGEDSITRAPRLCDLHTASKTGDWSRVKFLLSQGRVDIDCQEWIGRTPVMWAASGGHKEVVELLVKKGANLTLVDSSGINILHSACLGGNVELVKYVLSQNILDVNGRVWCGRTAVMLAAENGDKDMVELLVDKGADVSLVDETGQNILHCACMGGDTEVVKHILSREMVDINSRGYGKKTPLMVAGAIGHNKVVDLLLKYGADVFLRDKLGDNVLHAACDGGHFGIVKYVVSRKLVDIDSRGWRKRTPVMVAAKEGHTKVVEWLVKEGADLSLSEELGNNILHIACFDGEIDLVKYILSLKSVDIDSRGWKKRTPVMVAADQGHKEVVELMVKHGADISLRENLGNIVQTACYHGQFDVVKYVLSLNLVDMKNRGWKNRMPENVPRDLGIEEVRNLSLTDEDGQNILHLASIKGRVDVVKLILSLKAVDINSRGWRKMTPVMEAAAQGHKKVVELLVEHGADLLLTLQSGSNILHLACYEGQFDVVKYLLSLKSLDINSRGYRKRTPVMIATEKGHKEVLELLVKYGADLLLSTQSGNSILHIACNHGQSDVVEFILSLNTVDINSRGWKKRTPVMVAVKRGHVEVVELLVEYGADLLLSTQLGNSILHIACIHGQFDVLEFILSLNTVDINSRGWKKRTPVMVAAEHGKKDVVGLLVQYEADITLTDVDGKNSLDLARQEGHLGLVQYVMSLLTSAENKRES